MNPQENLWRGAFGDAYLDRNRVNWKDRIPFWSHILNKTQIRSACELGCSSGWNLLALRELGVRDLVGVEINPNAVAEAKANGLLVEEGRADMVSCLGGIHDLTFTSGVLIHVGPQELEQTMKHLIEGSRKYVLAVEYASDFIEEVNYRGQREALWKRPYGELYAKLGLKLVDVGNAEGFNQCMFWLMEKP